MARMLFILFKDMKAAADRGDIVFETYHNNITDYYKRMDYAEQGLFHAYVAAYMLEES